MSDDAFSVLDYTPKNLFASLGNRSCTPSEVARKSHAKYLAGYLSAMGALSIIVEPVYVDGDYLDDFASYYVKCFKPYDRFCKRVHFFSERVSREQFLKLVARKLPEAEEKRICGSYLGFCVARPLPEAIVGRTVLNTYPHEGRRYYTATRPYAVNLFGVPLQVDSLAFQEQDTVMAACATVALWCCFQKTGYLFQSPVPTPATITRAANLVADDRRPLPSHGLKIVQICNAIKSVGLEPEVIPVSKTLPLASLLYGYLRFGVPVILVVEIEKQGHHAVALTGYSLRDVVQGKDEPVGPRKLLPMVGRRIDEFYAHDDQMGPFSKLPIIRPGKDPSCPITFSGWKNRGRAMGYDFLPRAVVIPLYGKVRLTFVDIQKWLGRLAGILRFLGWKNLEWDIYLTHTNERKTGLRANKSHVSQEDLTRVLLSQHPRFAWRSLLRVGGTPVLDILADATDIERSFPFYEAVWMEDSRRNEVREILADPVVRGYLSIEYSRLLSFLLEHS